MIDQSGANYIKNTNNTNDLQNAIRKGSMADSEQNTEEMQEDEEVDIRRKINQKLIKNKNYFMQFMGRAQETINNNMSNQGQSNMMMQMVDKRSRSETPDKMSATEVLFRAHQKLAAQAKRKESPHKLLEKHQLRQKKAEELRLQIEKSKKDWYEKIRNRQQIAKERWKELLAERKAKLYDKLEQAEERRETEIQTLKNKAKQEIQKIDETNYIMKMTMKNMKLDLNLKMNETQERRNQIMEEYKRKKQQDRALKEEAAEKRRQELQKSTENKFLTNQQKREQADKRRNKMIEEKKKAAKEAQKRSMVLQRKNDLGDKIIDVMSFVNNSECIWEFLGNERDWQELGAFDTNRDDDLIYELLQKDQIEIEKLKLKKDADLLNKMIAIDQEGQIYSRKEYIPVFKKKHVNNYDFEDSSSSSDSYSVSDSHFQDRDYETIMTPEKAKRGSPFGRRQIDEEQKSNNGDLSEASDKASIPEESLNEEFQQLSDNQEKIFSEEIQSYLLYSSRLKMSMKRNVLKKNLSEDLTWADFLKNENFSHQQIYPQFKPAHTRSMRSTPERKQEIPNESEINTSETDIQEQNYGITSTSNHKQLGQLKNQSTNHSQTLMNLNNSSCSNLSEKSRLSSVVYPKTQSNIAKKINQIETDSARKKQAARMHSSSVQESSNTVGIQNLNQLNPHCSSLIEDQPDAQSSLTHTGSQMNQLITNTKPIPPQSKVLPKKLTVNASKLLFPIREQKLLMKRPGKEGQFGIFKIQVKIEDILQQKVNNQTINTTPNESPFEEKLGKPIFQGISSIQASDVKDQTKQKSSQNTPQQQKRKESLESNNNSSTSLSVSVIPQDQSLSTPTQQTSRLLKIQQKFWEKYVGQTQQLDDSSNKKHQSTQNSNSLPSDYSPSPAKKESNKIETQPPIQQQLQTQNSDVSQTQIIDLSYKDLMIRYLLTDNIHLLRTDDSQKTIAMEGQEAEKLIDYLEQHELNIRYCRLCETLIPDHICIEAHLLLKSHKKTRDDLGIKESEDQQFSVLNILSQPGDIEKELLKEKEKALKRKVKRIKAQMIAQAVSHESASYCPGKEYNSTNKKRFQILCIDLEKQVMPIINNYEALENTLKEIIKILDLRKQADLHLMRKLKYIPILVEICKRISVCHKNEFKYLGRVLDYVIKIINVFCGLRENRNYMLQTNRMLALIELLNWCLNRPTQLFYAINFLPSLFHILTLHVKHRAPYECQQMKEMFIEYLVCSQITMKIKSKFQIINGPLDLSEMMGQVPLFLLKSAAFIESITNLLQTDAVIRPVYKKSTKIGEHLLFVIQNTELFGIIPMITTILLTRNQPYKPSQQGTNKILPQTLLSLAITSIKILNNVLRMDYRAAQQMMTDFEIQEQLYHLFNYLLYYTVETADQQEDSKELLHETILLIGYYTMNNEKHQQILCKGENTLLQKLCNLPFPYFCDKKLKEVLFPTLIQASYKNERSLAIMDQEISIELLVDYIQLNLKEELPKIIEEVDDYHSISSLGGQHQLGVVERRTRSPSQSSTSSQCSMQYDIVNGNSPFLPLYMRFPKKQWKDAITFYSKVLY